MLMNIIQLDRSRFRMLSMAWVVLLTLLCTSTTVHAQSLVFDAVSVLDMDTGAVVGNQTVIITDGTISWVGPASEARIPTGSRVVTGDFVVMPGLAEMHAHIPPASQGPDYVHDALKMYLIQGITTIRGMLGEASHLELRTRAANGEIISPRIFTSGPSFNGNSARIPDAAREEVRKQFEAGYDLLKLHPGLSVDVFDALTDEARSLGMDFSGHISYAVGLERTLASGKGSIDHLDRYMEFLAGDAALRQDPSIIYFGYDLTDHIDASKMSVAARRTAEAGVRVVPTNTLLENVFNPEYTIEKMKSWDGVDMMPGNVVAGWTNFVAILRNQDDYDPDKARRFLQYRKDLTRSLHENGVEILLGADAPQIFNPPGYSAHRELALLVDAGLSPLDAIATGTTNVGTYFDETTSTGKVAAGFRADLIVLDVSPLEVIPFNNHIKGVVASGRYYDEDQLQQIADEIRQRVAGSE